MKGSYLRRFTTMLLVLAMMASMFTICGFGAMAEETISWDYKDLLAEADRSQMAAEYPASEKDTAVGVEVYKGTTDATGMQINVPSITLKKGHTLKMVYKLWSPKNPTGDLMFRAYTDYSAHAAIADKGGYWSAYQAAETKVDPTYGYYYKEISDTFAVPETTWNGEAVWADGQTEKVHEIYNYFWIPGCNYNENPVQFYEFSVYDVEDNKLLYTIDGDDFNNATVTEGFEKRALLANADNPEIPVGVRSVSGLENFFAPHLIRFDRYVSASTAKAGDEIEVGVDFYAESGLGNSAFAIHQHAVRIVNGSGQIEDVAIGGGHGIDGATYETLPTQYDETYGFAYKSISKTDTLTQEQADYLATTPYGFNDQVGVNGGHDYANYPVTIYRYWIYNKTQDVYYANMSGVEYFTSGGGGTNIEYVYAPMNSIENATGGSVRAGQDITFDGLTAATSEDGIYAYNFNVTGTADATYTLAAYIKDGETLKQVGSQEFTATGSAQTVELSANVSKDMAGKELTFGIATTTGSLDVETISLSYVGKSNVWDYKDLLDADTNAAMEGVYSEGSLVNVPVGIEFDGDHSGNVPEGTNTWQITDFTTDPITLVEGHDLKVVVRGYFPNGQPGAIKTNIPSVLPHWDITCNQVSDIMVDETYGYVYQEFALARTMTTEEAGTKSLQISLGQMPNPNFSDYPFQFFGLDLYDATTNELLGSYDAQKFVEANSVTGTYSTVQQNPAAFVETVGTKTGEVYIPALSNLAMFNNYISTDNVQEGDILQIGLKFWLEEGYNESMPISLLTLYSPDSIENPESLSYTQFNGTAVISELNYEELEEAVDPTYGYTYKILMVEHEVTADEVEIFNAGGICVFVSGGTAWDAYPVNMYGIFVNNVTQEIVYADYNAQDNVARMGACCIQHPITYTSYNTDYAIAGSVQAKRESTFNTLTAQSEATGQYGYTFDVKGEADKDYILKAYTVDAEGKTTQVGQKTFTATGEEESVQMLFNLREANAGANLCFGIQAVEAALSVNTVTFDGRIGDCTENDEFENQQLANPVIEMIDNLPEAVAPTDEEAIVAARTAYDALEANIQALVSNLDKLTQAETDLAACKADHAAANAVKEQFDALPDELTPEDKEAVDAVVAAYNALTDAQKAILGDEFKAALDAAVAAVTAPDIVYGDVNGDGNINASDALLALQHSVKLTTLEGDIFTAADVDQNDKVDATDALYILQYSVKLIDTLPVVK